jgi:amyloid beta precursor protein binding protein 1
MQPLETFIAQDKVFTPYTLIVVAAPIDPAILSIIQQHATALQIPTFYLHCTGYYSHFSIQLPPAFPIVETHPEPTATTDLRLLKPWPALQAFAREKTTGMDAMNAHDKGHIPYIALLLHYLAEWQDKHDGKVPESYKEKQEFRDAYVRKGSPDEENFDEACAAVLKALNPPAPTSTVREIFTGTEAKDLSATSSPFWVIASAIQQFYASHGELPLPGAVPDMKAQSADYIQLQNIYKNKARADFAEVLDTVRQLEKATNRSPKLAIDEKEVENFCKGAAHIHLVRGRPFHVVQPGEVPKFGDRAKAMTFELTNPESMIKEYIAFLAWDSFVATHTTSSSTTGGEGLRMPGQVTEDDSTDIEGDTEKLTGIAHTILDSLIKEAGEHIDDPEYSDIKDSIAKVCTELARAGGGELHNIASLTGGMIAQEVIKVITRQYIPVDNTCLFDGVGSRAGVLRI